MFSDSPIVTVGFTVSPDAVRNENDAGSQTSKQVVQERFTQTELTTASHTQTDDLNREGQKIPPYNVKGLADFLNRIYPELVRELDDRTSNPNVKFESSHDGGKIVNLHNIEPEKCQGKAICCLSWNATGMSLAISISELMHESWCTHEGQIIICDTNASNASSSNSPCERVLHLNSCARCISFHPTLPSILAGGLMNGEVLVWDLSGDYPEYDPELPTMKDLRNNVVKHSDSITNIFWLDHTLFATSGKDGMIIVWQINLQLRSLKSTQAFIISTRNYNPRKSSLRENAEILTLSCWEKTKDFVVAVVGGDLLHCSLHSAGGSIPENPVVMEYEPHLGVVTDVRCRSGDSRQEFATCGTDSEIRIYQSRNKSPTMVFYATSPLFGIEWIHHSNGMLLSWDSSETIQLWGINASCKTSSIQIQLSGMCSKVTAVKSNRQRKGVVAIGTEKGKISIWMIPL